MGIRKKKPIQFTPKEQASYNELVANIRKELDAAYVKGVDFTVLEVKRRDYVLKKGGLRWRTTYRYICGICGAEQKVCHVDEFSQNGAR